MASPASETAASGTGGGGTDATSAATPPRARRRLGPVRTGLLAAVLFVVGLFAGGLLVGLLAAGPVVVTTGPGGDAAEGALPGGSLPPEDASARFVVSAPCLAAVNAAQDTFTVLDDLGEAAADLDAARLDEIVRLLIPLQARLEAGLAECEVDTTLSGGSGAVQPSPGETGQPLPTEAAPDDEDAGTSGEEDDRTTEPTPTGAD